MQLKCLKLCLGMDDEPIESLWVTVIRQTNLGDVVMSLTDCLIKKMKVM